MSYFGNITTNKRNNNYIINSNAEMSTAYWATYSESDSVTFTDAGDLVTLNNHGLSNGTKISFKAITSTTGISVNTTYYVISATTNTFQVSSSSGGSALPLTTNGSGTMVRSVPKTGTGGSPSISWISSGSSTALRQYYEFLFANVSGNSQGQGVKTDFKIDPADQAKVLTISFDYSLATATGTYANGDLVLYIIADPNGTPTIIQPAGYTILSGSQGTYLKQIATFQTLSNCVDYRLCIHVATPSIGYQLKFDNFIVGPQTVQYGAPVTDWVSYTPTGTWTTNTIYTGKWRRVGDSMEVSGRVNLFGSPTPIVSLTVNLPSGFSIDTNKLTTTANPKQLGLLSWFDVINAANQIGFVVYSSTTAVLLAGQRLSSASNHDIAPISATVPKNFTTGDVIDFTFSVPILGWSSTVQMSNDTDTRVVAAKYSFSGSHGTNDTFLALPTPSVSLDTHGALNTSNGTFTAPVSGVYRASCKVGFAANTSGVRALRLLKNADTVTPVFVSLGQAGSSTEIANGSTGVTIISLNAGETLQWQAYQNSGGALSYSSTASFQSVTFERLSGASAIAATETVAMRANKTSGSHTSSGSWQDVASWDSPSAQDTHGIFNLTTGVATIPVSGTYLIATTVGFLTNGTGVRAVKILKNGNDTGIGGAIGAATGGASACSHSILIKCVAGDLIKAQAIQSSGGSLAYVATDGGSSLSIVRVGN